MPQRGGEGEVEKFLRGRFFYLLGLVGAVPFLGGGIAANSESGGGEGLLLFLFELLSRSLRTLKGKEKEEEKQDISTWGIKFPPPPPPPCTTGGSVALALARKKKLVLRIFRLYGADLCTAAMYGTVLSHRNGRGDRFLALFYLVRSFPLLPLSPVQQKRDTRLIFLGGEGFSPLFCR